MRANDNAQVRFGPVVRTVAINAAITGFLSAVLKPAKPTVGSWDYWQVVGGQSSHAMAA